MAEPCANLVFAIMTGLYSKGCGARRLAAAHDSARGGGTWLFRGSLGYDDAMYQADEFNFPDGGSDAGSGKTRDVLSVTSLNRMARSLLESHFPAVLVEAEISNFTVPASGHWYLTLKDAGSQIRCAMFRNRNGRVSFKPRNGQQVLVKGRLSIYEGRGEYQLILDAMEQAGDGALRKAFEQLKARLAEEGLFEPHHKQAINNCYHHVGVVTSATGAAIKDILTAFQRRFPATAITIIPVAVQGANAADEIAAAIDLANRLAGKLGLEALIVGRGGGSLEDLQAFNEEQVARALFRSKLPVVSAVGHEIDFTISDFVADLRAPTPTAAAELMSPDQDDYLAQFSGFRQSLLGIVNNRFQQARQKLNWLQRQLKHPGRRLQDHLQTLDRLETRMHRAVKQGIGSRKQHLAQMHRTLLGNSPAQRLRQCMIRKTNLERRLSSATATIFRELTGRLQHAGARLNGVSPLQTLARGYSITYNEASEVLRRADTVKPGDRVVSKLARGKVISTVNTVEPDEDSTVP
ncbi:MAG: exodeoxyribonuclease VII large subunit [Pseudohongiellaceae bacterium]